MNQSGRLVVFFFAGNVNVRRLSCVLEVGWEADERDSILRYACGRVGGPACCPCCFGDVTRFHGLQQHASEKS